MIRDISSRQTRLSPKGTFTSRRFPLIALLVATSAAAVMACSSDDGDDDAANDADAPLDSVEPVDVPERDLPPVPAAAAAGDSRGVAPNGLSLPNGILDWRVVGVVDVPPDPAVANSVGTLRVIVGNATAVTAARAGQTNPWPEGTMLAHFQWTAGTNPDWEAMIAPGNFARITLMEKATARHPENGGWAYGVWSGPNLNAPTAADFDQVCIDCHTSRVAANDYVFTIPGTLPAQEAIDDAATTPNDLSLPAGILDWRVIGAASRATDPTPTIRVIVGNDIAVEAARSGNADTWPDGSMLAHYSWVIGDNNPNSATTVNAASFDRFTLMVKNAGTYAADGGWAYGAWATPSLTAPADAAFDRQCVECHTNSVGADNDFVFTRPGSLPTDLFPGQPQTL